MSSRAGISTLGQPSQEDRCRRPANALAALILLRYGEGERTFTDFAEACDDADGRVGADARERPSDEPAGCVAPCSSLSTSRRLAPSWEDRHRTSPSADAPTPTKAPAGACRLW